MRVGAGEARARARAACEGSTLATRALCSLLRDAALLRLLAHEGSVVPAHSRVEEGEEEEREHDGHHHLKAELEPAEVVLQLVADRGSEGRLAVGVQHVQPLEVVWRETHARIVLREGSHDRVARRPDALAARVRGERVHSFDDACPRRLAEC